MQTKNLLMMVVPAAVAVFATLVAVGKVDLIAEAHAQAPGDCKFLTMAYQQVEPYVEQQRADGYELLSMVYGESAGSRNYHILLCK